MKIIKQKKVKVGIYKFDLLEMFFTSIVIALIIGGILGWIRLPDYPIAELGVVIFPSLWDLRASFLSVLMACSFGILSCIIGLVLSKIIDRISFGRLQVSLIIMFTNFLVFLTIAQTMGENLKLYGFRFRVINDNDFITAIWPVPILMFLHCLLYKKNIKLYLLTLIFGNEYEDEDTPPKTTSYIKKNTWYCPECKRVNSNDTFECSQCSYII